MKILKKMNAVKASALGVLALGLVAAEPASSHTINLKISKQWQGVETKVVRLRDIDTYQDIEVYCKNQLNARAIKEGTKCTISDGSLTVRNLRHVAAWNDGKDSFWIRTAFDLIEENGSCCSTRFGEGNIVEGFTVSK